MRKVVLLRNACIAISTLSLAAAFLVAGHWAIVGALLAQAAFWFAVRKQSVEWQSACLLVMYVALAVAGILVGAGGPFIFLGTVAALAAWDLLNFGETIGDAAGPEHTRRLVTSHLRALSSAVIMGAVLSAAALTVDLHLPLVVVGALALALVAGLARAAGHLWRSNA